MLYWNEFKWNYNIPVECLSIRISGLSGRESTETRQGVSWNWPYLKLCHRNSRLSTKSGHQGGEGGCARDLSMNTLLWEGPPGITFWKWDRLPWASWAWQSAFFFWEMSGMRRYMSLNRNVPCCSRVYRTNIAHLLPMRVSMLRMGHLGKVASWIVYLSIICVFLCKSNINSRRIGRFWRDTTDNSISKYYLQSACARASTPSAPGRVGYAALSCAANVAASGWDSRSSRTLVR